MPTENSEMGRIFPDIVHAGPKEHLFHLKKLKETSSVPVFASLNALYEPSWVEYARLLEETGVDGLELNLYATPGYFEVGAHQSKKNNTRLSRALKRLFEFR